MFKNSSGSRTPRIISPASRTRTTVRGTCEGFIGFQPVGLNGFGYDPLFFMPEFQKILLAEILSGYKYQWQQ